MRGAVKSESPLPPFFKGGNSTGFPTISPPAEALPPLKKGGRGGFALPRTLLSTAALILTLALTLTAPAIAQPASDPAPLSFNDNAEERRFHALVAELRCVMCQNQSLADSNAQIAHDLRREVLVLMRQGKSDGEIRDFLVARYGEFVLYRPQVESKTWLLWFGPALVLLAGGFVVARVIRARGADAHDGSARNDEEQEW
ncbi:cytochrome c-type biogenesis protein CcmH [Lysobacter sp. ISL-42]|nr:cytochrome c-type biogenesis protein CcmH [Lysobacter sp. ISL-42]MBT2751798.1 cytochrome c-type biogenesis protein CcmH [Lysobacter sp. ISL-50]MBT2778150.1 cytochrome c-type biogenesis protein CcmH [Lysobacter sp. ISL-54]MBT2781791.1 cytochrome c-type biogenesis protein CcmH [Lysobacter sp. ISL-52]